MVMILELCRMKNKIFIFFAIFLFFYPVKAELIFENDFPKNFQGIWSTDCEAGLQVHVIGKNSSLWIDEDYVGLNISKTTNPRTVVSYFFGIIIILDLSRYFLND